jgi:hypothetical protein
MRGEDTAGELDNDVNPKLDAGLLAAFVTGVDTAGVSSIVVVVVVDVVVGEGMTTPFGGNETTPIDELRVGPSGLLRGTKTTPKIPAIIKVRETTHQTIWAGRFSLRDLTSTNLV